MINSRKTRASFHKIIAARRVKRLCAPADCPQMVSMSSDSSFRQILSLLVIVGGAILATQLTGSLLQIAVMAAAGCIALALITLKEPDAAPSKSMMLKRREEDLLNQARAAAYQEFADQLPDPILLVRDAKVDTANPAARAVLGDHIIGENVRVAIRHPAAAERLANPDTKHSGEPILLVGVGSAGQRWELRIHNINDKLKLVQLSDQSSQYAADKMRTDFVANASHELRTPIAAIKGFVETLQDPEAGENKDTRARFLKIMYDEADRMQKLIEDLMSLSRIEAERYQLPEGSVDLNALVSETQNFFMTSRNRKEQDFEITLPGQAPAIRGDHAQLSQLLHNLVSNAFKYGGKEAPVEIKVEANHSGSMMKLSVTDSGEGIEARHIPRLTERFYRVDKGRSKAIGGTGLGLSIVKHITERHGGRLEVNSEIGVGTTITVLLPLANSAPT